MGGQAAEDIGTSGGKRTGLSSFSVILVMMVLMVVGIALLPLLNVQYTPQESMESLSVSFSYPCSSARIVESEVTSKVEGVMNSLNGVTSVFAESNAESGYGSGYVNVEFKKGTDIEKVRFEAVTRLRQIRKTLPEGVNPTISGTASGNAYKPTLLSYVINSDMDAKQIENYIQKNIVTKLAKIEGVEEVSTSEAPPFQWIVKFNPDLLSSAGISPSDLGNALNQQFQNEIIGTRIIGDSLIMVRLRLMNNGAELEDIPVARVEGRLYRISDLASVTYQERESDSYYRINGLNTNSISISAAEGTNTIKVAKAVRNEMDRIMASLPENLSAKLTYDASTALTEEIHSIFFRSIMSLIFLLLFVLLVSRSFRYLAIIGITITANLLSAVIFYKLLDIDIELFSMAGITVSLGIIIDTAIVMTDHFTYYRNRKVMTSIAGALLTTIAALLVVFFLPEYAREQLTDFVWVIIINLTLSMAVAFIFIPALLDKIPLESKGVAKHSIKAKRHIAVWSGRYERYISWGRQHRKLFVILIIWIFGIPIHLLPEEVHHGDDYFDTTGGLVGLYNSTIGSKWYQNNKTFFEYLFGGAFNIFSKNMDYSSYHESEPELTKHLSVYATMPEGSTTQQANGIILEMENWISQYDGIELYESRVNGSNATIDITFDKETSKTRFPYEFKQMLWSRAMKYGGATWSISSLDRDDQYLTNSTYRSSWDNTIELYGYNYDILIRYAEQMRDSLLALKRVNNAEISNRWGGISNKEFFLDLDRQKITLNNLNVARYISYLNDRLYDANAGSIFDGEKSIPVRLESSQKDYYDLWHVNNDMIDIDSARLRLSDLGSVTKRRTGTSIRRSNQEYVVSIGFDFVGSWELVNHKSQELIDKFNSMMPLGFHAGSESYGWRDTDRQQALLLLLIPVIIFMICAIIFESIKKSLSIILMIPLGFVGLFLSFPIFGVQIDEGVFAAMVMLSGIVVNANIYLISEYNTVCKGCRYPLKAHTSISDNNIHNWVKAYNRKIIPTMLTIISTILGLVPFLINGKGNSYFWQAFATGVMGGMTFSLLVLILLMPVFVPLDRNNNE